MARKFGYGEGEQNPKEAQKKATKKRNENTAFFTAFLNRYPAEEIDAAKTKRMDEVLMTYPVERLQKIANDPKAPAFVRNRAAFICGKRDKLTLEAQKDMLDRVAGKATQPYEDKTQSDRPINIIDFSKPRQ